MLSNNNNPNIDARYGNHSSVGRDNITHNHYHRPSSSEASSISLSFTEAPIDHLSSHFTGREEELYSIGMNFNVGRDCVPTRVVIFGIPGLGKTGF